MSTSNKEQYYTSASVGKSRRGSPGETSSVFFQGQVPSAYTTQYTQPRSSPGRFMLNQTAFYQWNAGSNSPPLPESSFSNYETHDRYNTQPSYTAYPSARASSPIPQNPTDSRRLPPLTTTAAGGERWQQGSYPISSSYQAAGIRSPTASYPSPYAAYSANGAYTYLPQSADQLDMTPGFLDIEGQVRSSSPYRQLDANFTPPPISPASATEEPTIKKKRKRADANQLKVLNEVYARTAFPSTEERNALAKQLDMSPRSVQIWFQNKRQSMRQTNRQSTNTSNMPQQSFSVAATAGSSQSSSRGLGTANPSVDTAYITSSQDHVRAHHSSSPHRRDDVLDPRKWPSRGF